jgi:signal transduction histidine kinase
MTELPDRLAFAEGQRLEPDRSLGEPMNNAQKDLKTQGRLRSLVRANQALVEELDLPTVLRRIVEAAVDLVGARFGSLGVIAPDGQLEQFIHVGMPDDLVDEIGALPRGRGLLGALVDEPHPVRGTDLGADVRSMGSPPKHPSMEGFLGVPVRVRDELYGNLYLSETGSGQFSEEDEELLSALAAAAGTAIDNARLFDETQRRQRWSLALADITAALLSDFEGDPLELIADRVVTLVDSDLVSMVRPVGKNLIMVATARGQLASQVEGLVIESAGTMTARALETGQPVLVPENLGTPELPVVLGPSMVIPMRTSGEPNGALLVARSDGRAAFTPQDLEMAADFARQAGVALEITVAREDRQRFLMLEDRSRIASDLHDHVIQRLFAAGLRLQAWAGRVGDPTIKAGITEQIDSLDEAIVAIRTAVFAMTAHPQNRSPLRHRIIDVVAELSELFPASPRLAFSGPIDLAIPAEMAEDVLAVVREGLTNVARHADARETAISLAVRDGEASLAITDDGIGARSPSRRSGIANLEKRAERWNGSVALTPGREGGTVLTWRARIDTAAKNGGSQ